MGTRLTWSALPPEVRSAIRSRTGRVRSVRDVKGTFTSTFAAVVTTTDGPLLWVKGADPTNRRAAGEIRREALVVPLVERLSPRLLHHISVDGWEVLVSDYVDGRPISLSPGSGHLRHLVNVLLAVRRIHPPPALGIPAFGDRWADVLPARDRELLAGNDLLHTDLSPAHMLLVASDGRAPHLRVVGWGGAVTGPAWIDAAGFGMRLLRAGHSPLRARLWLGQLPMWRAASCASRRAFLAGAVHDARIAEDRTRAEQWMELLSD